MNNNLRIFLGLGLLVLLILGAYMFYGYLNQMEDSDFSQNNGNSIAAIDFTVKDSDGNDVNLSDFYGKPIVLNFWASWCPPCKSEMPDFEEVYKVAKDDVVFLMVNETDGNRETIEKGKAYVEENSFTFPVYYDTTLEAGYKYNVNAIPTTYFIDKEGNIANYVKGTVSKEALLDNINSIL